MSREVDGASIPNSMFPMLLCAFHGIFYADNWTQVYSALPGATRPPPKPVASIADCCPGCLGSERRHALRPALGEQSEGLGAVHVAYAADTQVFSGLLVSMLSLAEHLLQPESCIIHLIVAESDMAPARRLVACFHSELVRRFATASLPTVRLHALRPLPLNVSALGKLQKFRPAFLKPHPFVRIFLHEYLPGVRRVIWLDVDTVVTADVSPLYRMHMEHPLAAALEGTLTLPRHALCWMLAKCDLDLPTMGGYISLDSDAWNYPEFNSGVLVFDLSTWSSESSDAVARWIAATSGCNGDQTALNLEFVGRVDLIPWQWNLQLKGPPTPEVCLQAASILHFNDEPKPWEAGAQHRDVFARFAPHSQC